MHPFRLILVAALALTACKKAEDKDKGKAPPVAASSTKLVIALDDKVIEENLELGGAPLALTKLAGTPPLETWIAVEAIDTGGKVNTILAPAKNHPGKWPAVALSKKEGVLFGLKDDSGALEMAYTNIAKVTIKTKGDAGKPVEGGHGGGDSGGGGEHEGGGGAGGGDKGVRATPTADLKIEIETAAGASTFTGDKMVGLPEIHAPAGDTETPGWSLVDVLGAAGIKDAKAVVLTDEANATLRIEGDDWDPAKAMLYIKLNKSGQVRFREFHKTGDVWEVAGELRGLTKIKVL